MRTRLDGIRCVCYRKLNCSCINRVIRKKLEIYAFQKVSYPCYKKKLICYANVQS